MPLQNLSQDFRDLKNYIIDEKKFISTAALSRIEPKLRKVHGTCFSIAVWESHFTRKKKHQRMFLKEMRSDAIQSLDLILSGHRKSACLMIRGLIENGLKHVYYFDHPVEYEWLESRPKHYQQMNELYSYMRDLPILASYLHQEEFISTLSNKYDELSKLVHSKSPSKMQLVRTLESIHFSEDDFESYTNDLTKVGCIINLILAVIHSEIFSKKLGTEEEEIILNTMDKSAKRLLTGI